jgi:hypothetical protein
MDNKNLLKCCKAVLEFLEEEYYGEIPSPKQNIMTEILIENDWYDKTKTKNGKHVYPDMIEFTKYLNERYQLGYQISDEVGNMKPFFENHSRIFYKSIIRDLKIEEIIEDEMD